MSLDASFDELTEILKEEDVLTAVNSKLVVYNDDFNTFDWVIECFMQVCNHTFEQSEQLSLMIHFKGKAIVKTAPLDVLKPMKDSLVERGLSAVIESLVND
jgi:ATP-dependent Clp protease adaptor protein ClpS